MTSSLDKLASSLCGTSGIQYDKCKGNMDLINISGDYIASFGCERCRTKKTKYLDQGVLKNNFNHTSRFWECDEKFCLMIGKGVYPYEYISTALKSGYFSEKSLKKSTCVVMIRIIITFRNQIFL